MKVAGFARIRGRRFGHGWTRICTDEVGATETTEHRSIRAHSSDSRARFSPMAGVLVALPELWRVRLRPRWGLLLRLVARGLRGGAGSASFGLLTAHLN